MPFRNALPLVFCLITTLASAQSIPGELNLLPLPASYHLGTGQLSVDTHFSVALEGYQEPRLQAAVQRFLHTLSRQTGIAISYEKQGEPFHVDGGAGVHIYRIAQEALNKIGRAHV